MLISCLYAYVAEIRHLRMLAQLSSRRLSGRIADLSTDQPLAEETPLNSPPHHAATRILGSSRRPIIPDNGAYRVSRWVYDVILSQVALSLSLTYKEFEAFAAKLQPSTTGAP